MVITLLICSKRDTAIFPQMMELSNYFSNHRFQIAFLGQIKTFIKLVPVLEPYAWHLGISDFYPVLIPAFLNNPVILIFQTRQARAG